MKTSARNQFFGTVSRVQHGAVNDEIELTTAGGQQIVAIITHASTERLGLQLGSEIVALIKASSIILVTEDNVQFSTRNCLSGVVSAIHLGAVNTEVVVDLPNGGAIVAIVTLESSQTLGLAVGKPVMAIFKASSVILGVKS